MVQKKVEELVAAGNVLDEYGRWIPIEEKVRSERKFLEHLERGEVLRDRRWISLATVHGEIEESSEDIPVNVPELSKSHPQDVDATVSMSLETPEETIDMSIETVAAYVEGAPSHTQSPETDFPPETAELLLEHEESHDETDIHHRFLIDGKTQVDIPVDAFNDDDETKSISPALNKAEYEETVQFNIKQIQAEIEEKKKRGRHGSGK